MKTTRHSVLFGIASARVMNMSAGTANTNSSPASKLRADRLACLRAVMSGAGNCLKPRRDRILTGLPVVVRRMTVLSGARNLAVTYKVQAREFTMRVDCWM